MAKSSKPRVANRNGGLPTARGEETARLEQTFLRCPEGHTLPNRTNQGRCSPIYCAGAKNGTDGKTKYGGTGRAESARAAAKMATAARKAKAATMKVLHTEADAVIESMMVGDDPVMVQARAMAKAQKAEELVKLGQSVGRWAAMRAFFKVPELADGAQAEEWVHRRAVMLTPDALMEIERQLKLGDDHQRREAARDILDMNGMRKKEAFNGGGPSIILVNPGAAGGPLQVPWATRVAVGTPPISSNTVPATVAALPDKDKP